MGWQSTSDARLLAGRGYDIILVPASAYYFDMALDDDWDSPGGSWAGTIPVERVADFEPGRGWTEDERAHIVGIHACLWTEHVHDRRVLEHLLLPRLDAFAERAWSGEAPVLSTVG
jgi:hexosaminidase